MKEAQRSPQERGSARPIPSEEAQSDEAQVKSLIERWAQAISNGDREGILAHHSPDLLMFDFPNEVRGLDAYDKTWDFFFANPKGQISFVPHQLEVTAGEEVAFASCLVRCDGTSGGHVDLRLTVGLQKVDGVWTVIHEHHSVPTIEERFIQ